MANAQWPRLPCLSWRIYFRAWVSLDEELPAIVERHGIERRQAAGAKSLRQIAAALNGRGVATARGGKWEATTVANVLKRVAA